MKKLLILLLLLISVKSFSQNLKLYGKVSSYNLKETGKIYWKEEESNFNPKNFITYDKNKKFNFTISINKIKISNIKALVFAIDTIKSRNGAPSCIQTINVSEIVNAAEFKNLKSITLRTDLLLDLNCGSGPYYVAEQDNKGKFVGSYNLLINDTIRNIELHNGVYRYSSNISKQTRDYMNVESGQWSFDEEKKLLILDIWHQRNDKYGLVLRKNKKFEFIVNDTNGIMSFQSKEGLLTKK